MKTQNIRQASSLVHNKICVRPKFLHLNLKLNRTRIIKKKKKRHTGLVMGFNEALVEDDNQAL